jgi:hypothetical protein
MEEPHQAAPDLAQRHWRPTPIYSIHPKPLQLLSITRSDQPFPCRTASPLEEQGDGGKIKIHESLIYLFRNQPADLTHTQFMMTLAQQPDLPLLLEAVSRIQKLLV